MRGEHARLYTSGGWGRLLPPAFAYDLTKSELYKRAKSSGLVRYGKAPGSNDEDDRPLGLAYDIEWQITPVGNEMEPGVNSAPLTPKGNPFYGEDTPGLSQTDPSANTQVSYMGLDVKRNGAWSLWCYLHTPPKEQKIKLQQWFVGAPGAGYVFQIRSGTAEIAGLSKDWNAGDMQTLRVLWGIKKPTQSETDQMDTLKDKLFVDFESLSFENSTGKGDWYGNEFKVTFIPEARGVLHIVLEGLDPTAHQFKDILKTRKEGAINERSPITLYSAGGAFFFTLGYPRFREKATMLFGPLRAANYYSDALGALSYNYNASIANGQTVTMTKVNYDGVPEGNINFGFQIDIVNPDPTSTPWIWAATARTAPGPRVPIEEQNPFDTDVLYVPANPAAPRYSGPVILDIKPKWSGNLSPFRADVNILDMLGVFSAGKNKPNDRVATLETKPGHPLITGGIVTSVQRTNCASLKSDVNPLFISRADTDLLCEVSDELHMFTEIDCDPPPIGDGKTLGTHWRELLAMGGVPDSRMTQVPNTGKRLPRAALGEDWASRVDSETKLLDAMRSLFDSYGLGVIPNLDRFGNYSMVTPSTLSGPEFSSSRSPYPFTEAGRRSVLTPIDITYDTIDFFNHFIVTGGEKGDIVSEWTDWESINKPLSPRFIGRRKTKRLTNTGLRTQDDVDYAMRSLRWRYGRTGRRAEFVSSFHTDLWAGQRIMADGVLWEIDGLSGASWSSDEMRFSVVEVISQ